MMLYKALGVILLSLLCSQLIKSKNPAGALAVAMGGCLCAAYLALEPARQLLSWCRSLADVWEGRALLEPLLRCTGIALAVRLTSEACRDAGERALAAKTEILGSLCGLASLLPLLKAVMDLMDGI